MTDISLRELERRFRSSGSAEDEAAWLRARVQAGELEEGRLELAAYCGHEPARIACRDAKPGPGKLEDWAEGLRRWGKEAGVRAVLALARPALAPYWQNHRRDPVPRDAFRAAEDWVLCPCTPHARSAKTREFLAPHGESPEQVEQARALSRAARAAGYPAAAAAWAIPAVAEVVTRILGEAAPREVLRQELVPWALDYSDPVRDRVEARQREAAGD